jgi:hypothetical protein
MSKILKFYTSDGLDLQSSDYSRPDTAASGMKNVEYQGSIADPRIEKRKGSQTKGGGSGGFGLVRYNRRNPVTDTTTDELLEIGSDLYRVKSASLAVSYSGSASVVTMSLGYYDATNLACVIVKDGVTVVNRQLSIGYDTAPANKVLISELATSINAATGFTATASGTTSLSAAFLDVCYHDLKAGPKTLYAYESELISFGGQFNGVTSQPFYPSLVTCQDQTEFENPSYAALNNVLYIANGISGALVKYDGHRCYKAGLPAPLVSASEGSSGSLSNGVYLYKFRLSHHDNMGNEILGPLYDKSVTVSGGHRIEIDPYVGALSSYSFSSAVANGAQTSTTITVDSTHGLIAGDRVWMKDNSTYAERRVSSVTSSTVTFTQSVTVADNAVMSQNLRLQIWRTDVGGTTYKFIDEIPVAPYSDSSFTYNDTTVSGTDELTVPDYDFGPPPICRYVATYKNGLVVAGIPFTASNRTGNFQHDLDVDPSAVSFGDYENIEGFPDDGSFSVLVDSELGDKVTGIKEHGNSLIVFKEKTICRLTGDPTQLEMQRDWLSKDIGCLAHATIQEVRGKLLFLSQKGVYSLGEAQPPDQAVGLPISPVMNVSTLSTYSILKFKRSLAHVYVPEQLYVLYIPAEQGASSSTFSYTFPAQGDGTAPGATNVTRNYANSNARIMVLDIQRNKWLEWSDLNMAGGIATFNDALWFAERRYSSFDSAVKYRLSKRSNSGSKYDYEDHISAITWQYKTAWYAVGEPSKPKQFLRLRVNGIPTLSTDCTLTIKEEVNYLAGTTKAQTTLSMAPDSSLSYVAAQTRLADGKFRSARLIFENSAHITTPEIEGWEIEVDAPYVEELKK